MQIVSCLPGASVWIVAQFWPLRPEGKFAEVSEPSSSLELTQPQKQPPLFTSCWLFCVCPWNCCLCLIDEGSYGHLETGRGERWAGSTRVLQDLVAPWASLWNCPAFSV